MNTAAPSSSPTHNVTAATAWGWLACALAMASVGSTVVASRWIGADLPPFLATALRHLLALPLFGALMLWRRPAWPGWGGLCVQDRWLLIAQAAAGSVGYGVLLLWGLRFVPTADAGILVGTLPAMAGLLAVAVLGERLSTRRWVALGLATLGVMALVGGAPDAAAAGQPAAATGWGVLLLLGAVACEAVFILLNKRLRQPLAALPQSLLMSALGAVLAAAAAGVEALLGAVPHFSTPAVVSLLYYAVVPTVGGFLLWYAGSARLAASQAAVSTALAPVVALGLSVLILDEPVGWAQGVGLAAVLASIVLGVRAA